MYYLIRADDMTDAVRAHLSERNALEPLPFEHESLGACWVFDLPELSGEFYLALCRAAGVRDITQSDSGHDGMPRLTFGPAMRWPEPAAHPPAPPGVIVDTTNAALVRDGWDFAEVIDGDGITYIVDGNEDFSAYAAEVMGYMEDDDYGAMPISPSLVQLIYSSHLYDDEDAETAASRAVDIFDITTGRTSTYGLAYPPEVQIVPAEVANTALESAMPEPTGPDDYGRVLIESWSSQRSESMMPRIVTVVNRYAERLNPGGGAIVLRVPHGAPVTPRAVSDDPGEDKTFFIDFWTAPVDGGNIAYPMTPERVLGVPAHQREMSIYCEPTATWDRAGYLGMLIDEDTGFAYGYVFEDHLMFSFDAIHTYHQDTFEMLDKMLAKATEALGDADHREGLRKARIERRRTEARDHYVNWVRSRDGQLLKRTQRLLEELNADIERLSTTLTRNLRERPRLTAKIEALRHAGPASEESLVREFERLLASPKVADIEFDAARGQIAVLTHDIFIQHEEKKSWHHIGRFRVTLTEEGIVRFYNLTHQRAGLNDNMQAPHVFGDGSACYGNLEEIIPSLAAGREYSAIFFMAIAFLESVNLRDHAGKYLTTWPEVREAIALGERPISYAMDEPPSEGVTPEARPAAEEG